MTEHLDESLPGKALLLAEHPAEIGYDQQVVHLTAFPERAMANLPSAMGTGELALDDILSRPVEQVIELERSRVESP